MLLMLRDSADRCCLTFSPNRCAVVRVRNPRARASRDASEIGSELMKLGFIGLGAMGRGMASRLVEAGHEVQVWNRSPEPCEEFERRGARRAQGPGPLFDADAVFTMLADDD